MTQNQSKAVKPSRAEELVDRMGELEPKEADKPTAEECLEWLTKSHNGLNLIFHRYEHLCRLETIEEIFEGKTPLEAIRNAMQAQGKEL